MPASLAADLQADALASASQPQPQPQQQLVVVRISLECEGRPGGYEHLNLWGSEVLTAAILVTADASGGDDGSAADDGGGANADVELLLRSFWHDYHSGRRRLPRQQQHLGLPPPTALPPPPVAQTTSDFVRALPPRTSACGAHMANRSTRELYAARGAYFTRRLSWQRSLHPSALACVRKRAAAAAVADAGRTSPLTLVFVGDSHMRMLFAHAVALLGGNVSNQCGAWHVDLHNDIHDEGGEGGAAATAAAPLVRLSFVWVDGIHTNGRHGCHSRGQYSGRNSTLPPLPPGDLYFVGAPIHWEAAFCAEAWREVREAAPGYVEWMASEGSAGKPKIWVSANPRASAIACPACGCRAEGGEGRSNARILRLNSLAWSVAAERGGFLLHDTWALSSDAYEYEADGYDKVHFSSVDCNPSSPRSFTVVGVIDAIRAHAALTRFVCPN